MQKINDISAYPVQSQTIAIDNGLTFVMKLRFISMQYGWFIEELNYNQGQFIIKGLRICNSPNMLRQFVNKIPFGLGCKSAQDREPSLLEDFSSGASSLYVLNKDECQLFERFIRDS